MEETLVFPKTEDLIISANYTEDDVNFEKADVTFSTFGYDIGRCMLISPPLNAMQIIIIVFLFVSTTLSFTDSTFPL